MRNKLLMSACITVLVSCLCFGMGQAPSNGAKLHDGVPDQSPRNLLIRSYLNSGQLTTEERAFVLTRLSETAVEVEPALGQLWAEELFQLAFQLPMSWNRVAYEKNALTALAHVDADRALKLFPTMDAPIPTGLGDLPEDPRAFGAQTVFAEFWKRRGFEGLEDIQKVAQHLGSTGEYPYRAMAPIVSDLAKSGDTRFQLLFTEAMRYYSQGSLMADADEEFVDFLNRVWDLIPKPLERQALALVVEHLSRGKQPEG